VASFIVPDWAPPAGVRALSTTRRGGVSHAPWGGFNLGDHVGDDPRAVAANRALLRRELPAEPLWLTQVHGTRCVDAATVAPGAEADASVTRRRGVVCAVLAADCLPVLLCDERASVVGVAHAGWRGLAAGVIEATVAAMDEPGERLMAWLGPAIGPQAFEVGTMCAIGLSRTIRWRRAPSWPASTANGCATSANSPASDWRSWAFAVSPAPTLAPSAIWKISFLTGATASPGAWPAWSGWISRG
jgi:copper oxidase (laccase) domain-containing protein